MKWVRADSSRSLLSDPLGAIIILVPLILAV